MTLSNQGKTNSELKLGQAFPGYQQQSEGELPELMVSLSSLIHEVIFYHPGLTGGQDTLSQQDKAALEAMTQGQELQGHFVQTLVQAIKSRAAQGIEKVRIRLSDDCSYQLSSLLGGQIEPARVNPLMSARGVSRYACDDYKPVFAAECEVVKQLRNDGLDVEIVVPFVRSLSDAAKVIDMLAEQGLPRGLNGLKVLFSCDVPSSALLSEKLQQYFDGVVISTDNLAQHTFGLDRSDEALAVAVDTDNDAVLELVAVVLKTATAHNKPVLATVNSLEGVLKLLERLTESNATVFVTM